MEPWWASKLSTGSSQWWLGAIDGVQLSALPGKQRVGLINALVDLLRHLVSCKTPHDPQQQVRITTTTIPHVQIAKVLQVTPTYHDVGLEDNAHL